MDRPALNRHAILSCYTHMAEGEYVDLGNGVWLHVLPSYGVELVLEEDIRLDRLMEVTGQLRRQQDIPFAPWREPSLGSRWRTLLPTKHRLTQHDCPPTVWRLENPALNGTIYLRETDLLAHGILERNSDSEVSTSRRALGLVLGDEASVAWEPEVRSDVPEVPEPTVPMGMLQLKAWRWFDMDAADHGRRELDVMIDGVSNLARVKALAVFLGDALCLVRVPAPLARPTILHEDWQIYFPYSAARMRFLVTLLPGCFCGWTASDRVIYRTVRGSDEVLFTSSWRRAYVAANPGLDIPPLWDSGYRSIVNWLHVVQSADRRVPYLDASVEDCPERPVPFRQRHGVLFDEVMARLSGEDRDRNGQGLTDDDPEDDSAPL